MDVLVKFDYSAGRSDVTGVFACTKEELSGLPGLNVWVGESYIGKHGGHGLTLEEGHFTIVSEDQEFIAKFKEILGDVDTGFNPFYNMVED